MDRIIASNTVAFGQHDVVPPSGAPGLFTSGNPATGIAATTVPGYSLNMLVEELRNTVLAAGLVPSGSDWTQLLAALRILFVQAGDGVGQDYGHAIKIGWRGADTTLRATVDSSDQGIIAFQAWVAGRFARLAIAHAYVTSTSWVCPQDVTMVGFDIVGGGGAGGAGSSTYSGGGGGGGGRVAGVRAVTPGTTYTLTVGTGGGAAAAGTTSGSGGTSDFVGVAHATGGAGGGSGSPDCHGGAGGQADIADGGTYAIPQAGGYGTDGQASAAATGGVTIFGGNGGNSGRGDGGGRAGTSGGLAPIGPGGGGGGGYGSAVGGGGGGNGEIVLWY